MATPMCPHCKVTMRPYETVTKGGDTYHRYECPTIHCPKCGGGKCNEKILA